VEQQDHRLQITYTFDLGGDDAYLTDYLNETSGLTPCQSEERTASPTSRPTTDFIIVPTQTVMTKPKRGRTTG
jgi:hypothetical protein